MARITGSNVSETRIFPEPVALSYDELTNRVYYAGHGYVRSINVDNWQIGYMREPIPVVTTISLYENHVIAANSSALCWFTISSEININATGQLNIGQATSIATYDNRGHSCIIDACKVKNGECDDICIPMGQNRVCRCGYGLSLDANKQTCSSEPLLDNFIVVSGGDQNKRIFQISLVNRNASAFVLNTIVRCMVYDAVKKRIIWTDHEHHLCTGNIYYFQWETIWNTIGLISPDGLKRILTTVTDPVWAIALDPSSGLIFWTDTSFITLNSSINSSIRRMNMDGTTKITLDEFGDWGDWETPRRLTIDKRNKTIYVLSSKGNTYRCKYEPNTCVRFYRAGNGVVDLIVVGDYLYYSRSDQFYLTKLHKNNKLDISHIAENPDRIKYGVIGKVISNDSPTTKCSSNNGRGECSTFCHPTPTGYTCGCQDGDQLMTDNKICKLGPRPTDGTNATSDEYTITAATFASKASPAFTTEVTDTGSSSNLLYIGVSMGAVIVIIVAAIIVVKICKRSRANVQLHFGARYVRRKPIDDHSNVVNTSPQNIVDANIHPNMLDPIPDLNRDMDIPSVPVNPYLELEDGDTYDCISEGGLQLIRALPPPPDDTGEPLNTSVDGGDVEEENGGYCIGRVRHCQEEGNDGKQ
ncbi:hypothetical protein DPMN_136543 [Dreissena polymorpha]|uniref:Vitellogenin receptor n=1 Tax=Dreissena polymorpha TaxID=45954 RepID=A0A9D4JCR8_DREPO|nr:hypothetical protein DPMN_136543 [Dreissena polymorpha]